MSVLCAKRCILNCVVVRLATWKIQNLNWLYESTKKLNANHNYQYFILTFSHDDLIFNLTASKIDSIVKIIYININKNINFLFVRLYYNSADFLCRQKTDFACGQYMAHRVIHDLIHPFIMWFIEKMCRTKFKILLRI